MSTILGSCPSCVFILFWLPCMKYKACWHGCHAFVFSFLYPSKVFVFFSLSLFALCVIFHARNPKVGCPLSLCVWCSFACCHQWWSFLPFLARRRYLVLGRPGYRAVGLYFMIRHLLRTKEGSAILCIVVVGLQCYAWIPVIVKNEKRRTVTTHKRLLFANRPTQINARAVTRD